jgi:iron complex transport system substrate-binding protein
MKACFIQSTIFLLLFFSCSEQKSKDKFKLNPPQKNLYASYFKIYKQENFSVLITYLNVAKTDSAVYVLYSKEKPVLDFSAHYIKTPVQKTACFSSVFVGFLNKLEVLQYIKAVDNLDFITNPMIQYFAAEGSVKQLSKSGQLNIEETIISGAEVIFTNPSGDAKRDFDKRLLDANIIPVVCADYFENNPLGRAEWLKAFALFFGNENRADSVFNSVKENYLSLKASTDTCKYKPTVFTEIKTDDSWFVSGGKSSLGQLLNDAGADYLWKDNNKTESTALNMEQVFQKCLSADYWINLHLCNNANDLLKLDKRYEEFNAFKKGNIFNNNAMLNK